MSKVLHKNEIERKTFYYRRNGKKAKKTINIPADWTNEQMKTAKRMFRELDPEFIEVLASKTILTYSINEYVNGDKVGDYRRMVKKLKELNI